MRIIKAVHVSKNDYLQQYPIMHSHIVMGVQLWEEGSLGL